VSVAPDAGRAKVAVRFAEMLDAEFAVMHKTRLGPEQVSVTEVTGRVHGKVCIVGDDVTTTGGTLIAGARALREHGAREVWVYVTHALLSPDGLARLAGAEDIRGIVVTDTVPIDPREQPENLTVLTVAPLLAETIVNVFSDDSVSAIFGGENQLF
jgi:ribose-phosphate pyrophosphokinase